MKSLRLVAIAAAMSAVAGTAFADDAVVKDGYAFDQNKLIPTGVRAEVGTTGYGGALLWTANPYVGLALGYNGGDISWTDDVSINGTKYDADMDNKLAYLNAEVRPWGTSTNRWAQGLYVAAGQAFFASAGTTSTINFTNAMRVAGNNAQFYRSAQNVPLNYYFHLNMTNTLGAFKQIAIGYQEVVSIANTSMNQTGRAVECIAIIMLVYLTTSLLTSFFMNWYNTRSAIKER